MRRVGLFQDPPRVSGVVLPAPMVQCPPSDLDALARPRFLTWEHDVASASQCVHRAEPSPARGREVGGWGAETESFSRNAQEIRSQAKTQRRTPRAATPMMPAGPAPTGRLLCARLSDTDHVSLHLHVVTTLPGAITYPGRVIMRRKLLQMRKLRITGGK